MASAGDIIEFDENASRATEAIYTTQDVVDQRRAIIRAVALRRGERALDIGAGPGFLAAEMAQALGATGAVAGVDVSESMLALARRRDLAPGSATIEFRTGDALDLPFADASFDVAVATQVYEYVADMPAALAEARRVLAPDGRLAILDTDWDSVVWRSSDDGRMRRVMSAWDDHLVHRDLPRRLPQLLREAGFTLATASVVPLLNVGYREETYSGRTLRLIAGYVAGRRDVTVEDALAWADDLEALGEDYFFSVNRYLFVGTR